MPNTISHGAWSKLREITIDLEDYKVVNKMMEEAIKNKVRYTRKVVSRDKLAYLLHNRIGTSRIESIAKQVEGNDTRNPSTVCYIVKKQLNGLVKEINTLKAQIFQRDKDIRKKLGFQWRICQYTSACDAETSFTWHKEKKHSVR